MTGRGKPATIVKVFIADLLVFALSVGAVHAADLTNPSPAPPSPAPEAAPHWYVKLGALGALDQSWSSLFAQQVVEVLVPGVGFVPVGGARPQVSLVGRGATYSSLASVSFVGGYFFTANWSLEVVGAVPLWLNIKITGFSATPPFSGASLSRLLPGAVPITGVEDGFNSGGLFAPTVGLAAQAGSDYMFNRNWGVFFDVNKLFIWSTGKSTGLDFGPPIGTISAAAPIKTTFQP
jgi:hypothetical protein